MRKQDKIKNMMEANLIMEQSYLSKKNLLTENVTIDDIVKSFGAKKLDGNRATVESSDGADVDIEIEGNKIKWMMLPKLDDMGHLMKSEQEYDMSKTPLEDIYNFLNAYLGR